MDKRKLRIGLLLDFVTSEYTENLIKGVQTYCQENDIELLLFITGAFDDSNTVANGYNYQFAAIMSQINKSNLDGIITNSGTLHSFSTSSFTSYLKRFKPLKIVNIASVVPKIPSVIVDCSQAFEALIQHLIDDQGCRRFAVMSVDSKSYEVKDRMRILKSVMQKNKISSKNITVWDSNFDYTSAYRILTDHYNKYKTFDFDAIISLNDDMAFACIDFVTRRAHMNIPQDIAVTGFDNFQRANFYKPNLSSVDQQVEFQSYTAAKTLHLMLRDKEVPPVQTITAKAILRQSSAKNKVTPDNFKSTNYITIDTKTKEDFSNAFSISEWYDKRSQLQQAANFYTSTSAEMAIEEIGPVLTNQLRAFGFQSAAVVVYEKPIEAIKPFDYFTMPDKARILAGFDYQRMFNTTKVDEPVIFNPNETLIPPEYMIINHEGTFALALFHHEIQYGYLLLRANAYDNAVYDILQRSISNQLSIGFAYTKMIKEKSKIQKQNKKLDMIANTDALTGLRNRRGFIEVGNSALEFSEKMETGGLVVFCDMDGLKKINDTYGHEYGDIAIKAQGKILKHCFRTSDVLARLGGDEFALVCPGLTEQAIGKIKEHINRECIRWTEGNEAGFALSISVGYVKYPLEKDSYNLERLLSQADKSLYLEKQAKKAKKN